MGKVSENKTRISKNLACSQMIRFYPESICSGVDQFFITIHPKFPIVQSITLILLQTDQSPFISKKILSTSEILLDASIAFTLTASTLLG